MFPKHEAFDRLVKELSDRGMTTKSDQAAFLGVDAQQYGAWQTRGLSKDSLFPIAEKLGWSLDRLVYGKRPTIDGVIAPFPRRNAILGEVRRARLARIISTIGDDQAMLESLWDDIDSVLGRWERWLKRTHGATGSGAELPRSAPDSRKGKKRGGKAG